MMHGPINIKFIDIIPVNLYIPNFTFDCTKSVF